MDPIGDHLAGLAVAERDPQDKNKSIDDDYGAMMVGGELIFFLYLKKN